MDHCTLFPEGWWGFCCQVHDMAYDMGWDRASADFDLFTCVAQSGQGAAILFSPLIAALMYAGVRLFGWIFYPHKRRS